MTRDEFGVPAEQELATYVNDERRQFAKLQDMIFDVPTFIETVTAYVPLEPGDLLGHRHAGRRRYRVRPAALSQGRATSSASPFPASASSSTP